MDNIQIAAKIRKLCKEKSITVKSLLEACDINKGFMYELEKKGRVPLADKLELIADYLDVSIDYLVGRTTDLQTSNDGIITKEETELLNVYRLLDVRDRTKLMSFVFDLEDNLQKMQ